ncbi:hypothetical protein D3C76_1644720 [compost metagenome]
MIGQACVLHPGDLLMVLQVAGDLQRILGVTLHAQGQRLQALQNKEGVEWR